MARAPIVLMLAGLCVHGQDLCRNGLFTEDQGDLRLGRVIGGGVFFYQDTTPGCPQKGPECRKSDLVAPGMEVLVSKVRNGFACIWQSHDAVGWIPATGLDASLVFNRNPPLSAWAGDWKFFDNHLDIALTPDGQGLRVSGHAFWHGISTTHEGTVEGDAAPSANHMAFQVPQTKCEVRLTLVNHLLAVTDTRNCGGMNVTFAGVYERSHEPFEAQSTSRMRYGRNSDGQETLDTTNVAFELAHTANDSRLILRKTHTEHNVIGDEGDDPKITVEAWPLGVNLQEKPLYAIALEGEDAATIDNALLVFDRSRESEWWSVYHLDTGLHFFDTHAPLLRFSITDTVQTKRYAGLEISNDDSTDKRLRAPGVVGVLTYAAGDRVIREALITCDNAERAAMLHSLADTAFELAAPGKAIRVSLTPFRNPTTVITIPVVNDDLDLAHARMPVGVHLAAWRR